VYWRLSNFYLFYFAALGALWPYWGPYLKSLGYNEAEIGELVAIIMATKIVAPYVWGWIADHTGQRMKIVRLASLVAMISFAGIFFGGGYWWLALVMVVYSFFWNASLPQFEATTMTHLGADTHRYSSIRLWGSVGFIIAVAGLGPVLNAVGTEIVPWVFIMLLAGIWVASLLVPEQAAGHLPLDNEPILKVLCKPAVAGLFVVCFLLQASHGPYYTFYSIYLQQHDYSFSMIGGLWALGVLAEIGVFVVMPRLLPCLGARWLLVTSLVLASVRWLLIGYFVTSPAIIIFAQLLHAASFGVYHAVAISLIHHYFTGRHQGRGQALYSSLSFGAGGALGSIVSGYLWVGLGPVITFAVAAIMSGMAALIAWRVVPGAAGAR
jgi:PPP family 3-phenylpropionic acid transporter